MNKVSVVVSKLLDLIGVQATKTTVIEMLTSHPHYPSLLAVRDTLFSLKVLNVSCNLEPQHLKELPTPCIAHLREGYKEQFTIVKAINNNQVTRLEGNSQWVSEPITEFEKRWSGIAMLVEVQSSSGEVDYVKARLKEWLNIVRIPFLFLFLGFALIGIFLNHVHSSPPINWWFVLSIHILGMIVSLILMTEFFNGHKYIKKICGINSQLDCTSVLKSDQSKLWGVISWSELVFIYYTGSILWLAFSHQYNSILSSLFYLSLLTLPFTIYSLYYQFFKQRKICLICILIVGLLWTDTFILYHHYNFPIGLLSIYSGLLSFSIPIASWSLVKPWIENLQKTKKEIISAKKLKTDPSFFTTVLHQQKKMPPLEDLNPLVLGDKTALNTITVVTNPKCGPCQQLHQDIMNLVNSTPDVKCHLIFAVGDNPDKEQYKLAQYFLSEEGDELRKIQLLDSWYKKTPSSFTSWVESHSDLIIATNTQVELNLHSDWCKRADIRGTPTIFVNSHQLPKNYDLNDLRFIFSSL